MTMMLVRLAVVLALAISVSILLGACAASLRANGDELIGGEVRRSDDR